jgi:hypothetical protein
MIRVARLEKIKTSYNFYTWTKESANLAAEVITKNTDKIAQGKSPLTAVNSF